MTADELAEAKSRALRFLGHRDRSRREVEERLARYGYEPAILEAVTAWLEGLGYLDDVRYAEALGADKRRQGWGPGRIRQELQRRGVPADVADGVVGKRVDEEDLVALVRRRFGALAATDGSLAKRRAHAYLARKGHEWDVIVRVTREALGAGVEDSGTTGEP